MQETKIKIYFLISTVFLFLTISCSEDAENLVADYKAPQELPPNLVAGTPLSDKLLQLYEDYGIIVYTDTIGERNYHDVLSEDALQLGTRIPADTAAAILYANMIEDEFIKELPDDKKNLIFRNFYLYKNELSSGSGYSKYDYFSYLWYNSNADLTVGGLDSNNLDTLKLKQSFIYGLSGVLRADPVNKDNYYFPFTQLKTDAGVYYWQVTSQEIAYEKGFLSDNQNLIKSDQQDFDLYAAWSATVKPSTKDSILDIYPLVRQKYNLVNAMFRQEGIPLEQINQHWQESKYNPKN